MMHDVEAANIGVANPASRSAASRTVMVHLRRLSVTVALCALVALLRLTPAEAAVTGQSTNTHAT